MEAVISFLSEYRLTGLTVGIFTFLIIGLFHPLVIKAEYWFGTRSWWMFLVLGIAAAALSVCVEGLVLSILFGVVAFSSFWSILEVFQQRERVRFVCGKYFQVRCCRCRNRYVCAGLCYFHRS